MKTQPPGSHAFMKTAAQLMQCLTRDGESVGVFPPSDARGHDILQLHSHISKDLSVRLGLHPQGLGVPFMFSGDTNIDTAFVARMNWNFFRSEYYVLYNNRVLQPYFQSGQLAYPVKTDAQFTVPIGAILLYMVSHEITHAFHWMSILGELPTDFQFQDSTDKYMIQYNHFFNETKSKPFVEGIAELGALIHLRNMDHPFARRFAALHFTTRMIEAAYCTSRSPGEVEEEAAGMIGYFLNDDVSLEVHDLTVRCFEHCPDWIVGPQRYAKRLNDYGVGLMHVGELVFSKHMSISELMRLDLSTKPVTI